jgi:phosphoribosylaminoimidazole carboxylase PurE protein
MLQVVRFRAAHAACDGYQSKEFILMKKSAPLVSIVMGSDSDFTVMKSAMDTLAEFNIPYEVFLTSAHRSPERTYYFATGLEGRGIKVVIVGAGAAAHLAGVIASQTALPVIGVPLNATSLNGMDALLSTVQMPGGIPVATMAIGTAGAKNAALLAVRVLSLQDRTLRGKLQEYSKNMSKQVEEKQEKINCLIPE